MRSVAIIGTAGRGKLVSRELYKKMVRDARRRVLSFAGDSPIKLQSGGAAVADHAAVSLWLMRERDERLREILYSFHLYFPCGWNGEHFCNSKSSTIAGVVNYYHQKFSNILTDDRSKEASCRGIRKAIEDGATYTTGRGFLSRNLFTGNCDFLIAYTWSKTDKPLPGGTNNCWNNSNASQRIHIPLSSL